MDVREDSRERPEVPVALTGKLCAPKTVCFLSKLKAGRELGPFMA